MRELVAVQNQKDIVAAIQITFKLNTQIVVITPNNYKQFIQDVIRSIVLSNRDFTNQEKMQIMSASNKMLDSNDDKVSVAMNYLENNRFQMYYLKVTEQYSLYNIFNTIAEIDTFYKSYCDSCTIAIKD